MGAGERARRDARTVAAARAVAEAPDLESALRGLVRPFAADLALARASVLVFLPTDRIRIIATWPAGGGPLPAGSEIAVTLTPGMGAISSTLVTGRPVVADVATADMGLVRDIALHGGLRTIMAVPVFDERGLSGVMTLWSTRRRAFGDEHADAFMLLGARIGPRLGVLIDASGRAD